MTHVDKRTRELLQTGAVRIERHHALTAGRRHAEHQLRAIRRHIERRAIGCEREYLVRRIAKQRGDSLGSGDLFQPVPSALTTYKPRSVIASDPIGDQTFSRGSGCRCEDSGFEWASYWLEFRSNSESGSPSLNAFPLTVPVQGTNPNTNLRFISPSARPSAALAGVGLQLPSLHPKRAIPAIHNHIEGTPSAWLFPAPVPESSGEPWLQSPFWYTS
jgi:hypothetical protein